MTNLDASDAGIAETIDLRAYQTAFPEAAKNGEFKKALNAQAPLNSC